MGKRYSGNTVRGGGGDFPEGTYRGTIAQIEDSQSKDGKWGSVNFQMVDNTLVDGEREPGARPHFVRVTTYGTVQNAKGRDETLMVADIDPEDESITFSLRKAAGTWCQLAAALGAATILDDGGVEFADSLEAFIEEFRDASTYDGVEVEFVVSHSISKKEREAAKAERRKPHPFVNTAFVVPEAGAETPAAEADDEETEAEDAEETEAEEEVEEEETPAPAPRRTAGRTLQKAQARQTTTKASGAPRGSGKAKFTRKGRR